MQAFIEKLAKARGVDLSQAKAHFRVESGAFMPLVVENIGYNQISIAHYYTQNGDMLADPDVVFWVGCDGEWYPVEWTTPAVMLGGRVLGGFRRYVEVDLSKQEWVRADIKGQRDLAIFSNKWAANLRAQGFE